METASTINTAIQIASNCVGFVLFFMLLKSQIKKRDDAFDKVVEVLNGILTRLAVMEKDQEHMSEDIRELKGSQRHIVEYNNPKKR